MLVQVRASVTDSRLLWTSENFNNGCYSLRGAKSKVFRAESQACQRREHYRHAHYKLLLYSEILIDAYSIVK